MALIDVVKSEVSDNNFVYKYPSDDLRLGTQLVVYPAQTAFFLHGGKICDEFTSGTYTLNNENIPILNKLINLPFGQESPFKAEVWFVNQVSLLGVKWGTPQPMLIEDPKYNIIVPVRAYGQYGFRIAKPRCFLESLIGNMASFSADKIEYYFKGRIVSLICNLIAQKIVQMKVSILDINLMVLEMSSFCQEQLNEFFVAKFGVEIVDFNIISINVPQDDPSIIRLKTAKDTAVRLKVTGRDVYQMERSFDVLEIAASNNGSAGQMLSMGAGVGAGLSAGTLMGNLASQTLNRNSNSMGVFSPSYIVYVNGQQISGQTKETIATMMSSGIINADTLVWSNGMTNWMKLSQVPELSVLFQQQTPPPIPSQN